MPDFSKNPSRFSIPDLSSNIFLIKSGTRPPKMDDNAFPKFRLNFELLIKIVDTRVKTFNWDPILKASIGQKSREDFLIVDLIGWLIEGGKGARRL